MVTIMFLLAVAAFITLVVSVMGKCPLWVPVLLLCVIELLRSVPLGR